MKKNKRMPPVPLAPPEDMDRLLSSDRPILMAAIGFGGLAIILWLMLFKPF